MERERRVLSETDYDNVTYVPSVRQLGMRVPDRPFSLRPPGHDAEAIKKMVDFFVVDSP